MVAVDPTQDAPRTYGNWRRPTSPGLLGLGTLGTLLLFAALFIILISLMSGGLLAAFISAVVSAG